MRLVMLCGLLAGAEPELRGTPAQLGEYLADFPQTIVLTGTIDLPVSADRVIFTLSVAAEAGTLGQALRTVRGKKEKVIKALKAKGIAPDKIVTLNLPAVPLRPLAGEKRERYKTANVVRVLVESEKDFETAADLINTFREVEFQGMSYELADGTTPRVKALETVCADINKRKEAIEAKFGVALKLKGVKEEADYVSGERIQVEGSTVGRRVNPEMGLYVLRMKVQAEYVIQSAGKGL